MSGSCLFFCSLSAEAKKNGVAGEFNHMSKQITAGSTPPFFPRRQESESEIRFLLHL